MKTGSARRLLAPVVASVMVLVLVLLARSGGLALCPRIVLTPDKPAVTGFELAEASRYPSHVCVRSADGLKMFSQAPFEFDMSGFKGRLMTLFIDARSLNAARACPMLRITCPNGLTTMLAISQDGFCRYKVAIGDISARCMLRIEYVNDSPSDGGGMDIEIKNVAVE